MNLARNNGRRTVADEGYESSFVLPTQSGLEKASEYDNIKNCPVYDYVAYPFTYQLFNKIVTLGNLK
jgi:hypothetical protein